MKWFNSRFITTAFEKWRYGRASLRVPMKEIFEAGFTAGVLAEREACIAAVDRNAPVNTLNRAARAVRDRGEGASG